MPDDNNTEPNDINSQKDVLNIMKELQPVAFLLSICLVFAAFYVNPISGVARINLTNVLMASLFFFFAYVGLFFFKKTDFPLFLYFGECSLIGGGLSFLYAFKGIINLIRVAGDLGNSFYMTVTFISFLLIASLFLSGKVKKGRAYNFCKVFFHLSLILFVFHLFLYLLYPNFSSFQQAEFYNSIYLLFFNGVRVFLFITSILCFCMMISSYFIERFIDTFPPLMDNLFAKLRNFDTFGINIFESLEIIAGFLGKITAPIIGLSLTMIGFWLLIDNQKVLLSVIAIFITGFCLIWYRELFKKIRKI